MLTRNELQKGWIVFRKSYGINTSMEPCWCSELTPCTLLAQPRTCMSISLMQAGRLFWHTVIWSEPGGMPLGSQTVNQDFTAASDHCSRRIRRAQNPGPGI